MTITPKQVEQVNKHIATRVMGLCWHRIAVGHEEWCCEEMQKGSTGRKLELLRHCDYTSPSSPRSLLDEAVAKITNQYQRINLMRQLFDICVEMDNGFDDMPPLIQQYIPTAEQLSLAIFLASGGVLEAEGEKDD